MESISSSSSMAVPIRDSSPADDDGTLSVTAGLAKEAALLFQSGKLADCLHKLKELLEKKEGDPKILHNIALVEYFQDGFSHPKRFLEVLDSSTKKRSEQLAITSGEPVQAASNNGSKALTGTKETNSMVHQLNGSPIVYSDKFDTSVTMFNIAVTWFHLHEYEKSFSILEKMYQNIEPIDEATAFRICLLMLDVALFSHHVSRSMDVINYVEKVFCVNNSISQAENGGSLQQQSSTQLAKASPVPYNSTITDAPNSDSPVGANASESPISGTLSEDTFEDDPFFQSIDISGQDLHRPCGLQSANDLLSIQTDDYISTIDLRLKLHLYKIQYLLFARNLKAAKREIKMAMNIARGKDYTMALFLKSQLEYARGNHRKAIKLLMATSSWTEKDLSSIYYNNLGCIYYQLGKHHTSSVFFSKALNNCASLRKEKPLKLSTFSQDKSLLIVYNCGMQYLACEKPVIAAQCFHKASLIFYKRPLLWLRLAECCLMAVEKGLVKSSLALSDRSELKVHVTGRGKWRHLVMDGRNIRNGQIDCVGNEDSVLGDDRRPNLSMTLARQCLTNALHLLDSPELKDSKPDLPSDLIPEASESTEMLSTKSTSYKSVSGGDYKVCNATVGSGQVTANGELKELKVGNSFNAVLQNSITDYEDMHRKECQMVKQAVLADLAYVELKLGNPLKALSVARSLLKLPDCCRVYIFLGNLYAAEALCTLNRPEEAAEHLLTYMLGGTDVELPYSQEDCEHWRVERPIDSEELTGPAAANAPSYDEAWDVVFIKPEEARGTLYANLATMYAVQGDLEKAHHFVVQALSVISSNPEAIVTAIYVDLLRGKTQDAISKLKQCSQIRFVPGNLTLNSSS